MTPKPFTRRDFLKAASVTPLAGALLPRAARGISAAPAPAVAAAAKSRVVLVRDAAAFDSSGRLDGAVVQKMLDDAVVRLLDAADPVAAWKSLLRPDDVVGVKSNDFGGVPTTPQVEDAIRRRVLDAGVKPGNVAVDDRGVLSNPVFKRATALVNAAPARTHAWSGMGTLIKNYIMFAPVPESYHEDACADLARLWDLPIVKGKTRLNIQVLLRPLYHSTGPHIYIRERTWDYKGLAVSLDPVAADSVALRILTAKRRREFGEDVPLQPPAHHIRIADEKYHLGASAPDRIELVTLGWTEDALV